MRTAAPLLPNPLTGPMTTEAAAGPEREAPAPSPADTDFAALPGRSVTLSMVCVLLAMFLAALSQTVVATLLPLMVADMGGFERYAWAVTAYIVAATVVYPIAGRLSDIHGRKRSLIAGLAVFMVGSALVGLSASMTQVIAFRAIQGIGGGIVMTCCYVAIADLFPPEDRGKYHGLIGAAYGVASVAGPILGGVVVERLSWQWAFVLIALAGIPILALTARIYPAHHRTQDSPRLDLAGMAALVLAVVPLLLALSSGGVQYAWDTPLIVGLLAFGVAMSGAFVVIEARTSAPIMPLGIYANRVVSLAVVVTLLTSLGLYGGVLFLPLFFQVVLGVSATASGTLLVPMLLGMVAGGIVSGQLLSRAGGHYRMQVLASSGLMAVGMYLLSTMNEATSLVASVCYISIAGLGFGGTVATLSVAVQNSVPFALVGAATAALQFFRSLGGMLGLAVLGAVMARSFYLTLDSTLPDPVREALPQGGLEALRNRPAALDDRFATESLTAYFAEAGPDGHALAALLHDASVAALSGALNDVFSIVAAVTVLSFVGAILFRVPPLGRLP